MPSICVSSEAFTPPTPCIPSIKTAPLCRIDYEYTGAYDTVTVTVPINKPEGSKEAPHACIVSAPLSGLS